jgi:hypothetical protein
VRAGSHRPVPNFVENRPGGGRTGGPGAMAAQLKNRHFREAGNKAGRRSVSFSKYVDKKSVIGA